MRLPQASVPNYCETRVLNSNPLHTNVGTLFVV